jgi:DNA-binding NarL/FixJ family response regulator
MEDTANERNAILLLVANGMAPTEIASVLGTDNDTIERVISTLCVELGASDLIELVLCIHSTESALRVVAPTVSRRLA